MTVPMMTQHLLHPSGGLIWHWRAWRNRTHWIPLMRALQVWLDAWITQLPLSQRSLVLIGPSAGWTLPLTCLQQFDAITVFEPDILAQRLLRLRLPGLNLSFDFHDVFSPEGMHYLHVQYPSHALLFCNVLGQLSPEDEHEARHWCKQWREMLKDRHWASYHDWISTEQPPDYFEEAIAFTANTPLESVLRTFWRDNEIEIHDHNTEALGRNIRFACIPWRLRKNQWHLIQWIAHTAT